MKNLMPVLFIGHGNPMNAIEKNEFQDGWKNIAKTFRKPKAIICISAHWETHGSYINNTEKPKTIHDFSGFPLSLYKVEYDIKGNPKLASEISEQNKNIMLTNEWGIDHGTWVVLMHMYPAEENIPVMQLSINHDESTKYHYELGKTLKYLREQDVLIVGSGNIVHNLQLAKWTDDNSAELSYLWAKEFNDEVKNLIIENNHEALIDYKNINKDNTLNIKSVPTAEHYIPLLYTLAMKEENDKITFFNDKIVMGSMSMTCVKIGE